MKFIGIAMILVVVALGYSKSWQPKNLDTLLLDNVEALARDESGIICRTNANYSAICNIYDKGAVCSCGF